MPFGNKKGERRIAPLQSKGDRRSWARWYDGIEMLWGIPGDVAIFAIAVVAFFVVGLLFVTKAFIWCFLLTYVILRLVGPTGIGVTFGLSLWTGVVADWAAKRRQKRQKLV